MIRTSPDRSAPLVFAHRGSSGALPEHTLGAYLRAISEGADGLECDVRLTRDGQLVCVHDRRLDRTSNGTGVVSRYTLDELNELDFGSWHPNWADSPELLSDDGYDDGSGRPKRLRVLTLDRLLAAVFEANRPLRLLIETKHPTRFGGDVEERLIEMLRKHGVDRPDPTSPISVTVMSFSSMALRRVRELAPELDTVWLSEFGTPGLRNGRVAAGAPIAGPGVRVVRAAPGIVARLQANGRRVYVWTVDKPADIDLVLGLGVDGIISNHPRLVLDHLGR